MKVEKIDNETMRLEGTPKDLAWLLAVAEHGHIFATLFRIPDAEGAVTRQSIKQTQTELRKLL